jgi:ketosteroid isomerase-like protein
MGMGNGDTPDRTMSTNFVEVVQASYAAFSRGDLDFLVAHADPEIEIVQPHQLPGARTYHGHEGLVESIGEWAGEWDDFHLDVERTIDAGRDRVITIVRHHGRGKSSGAPVEMRWVYVHTGRDGKHFRWEIFTSLDDAFAAIGLRKLKGER